MLHAGSIAQSRSTSWSVTWRHGVHGYLHYYDYLVASEKQLFVPLRKVRERRRC